MHPVRRKGHNAPEPSQVTHPERTRSLRPAVRALVPIGLLAGAVGGGAAAWNAAEGDAACIREARAERSHIKQGFDKVWDKLTSLTPISPTPTAVPLAGAIAPVHLPVLVPDAGVTIAADGDSTMDAGAPDAYPHIRGRVGKTPSLATLPSSDAGTRPDAAAFPRPPGAMPPPKHAP